MAYLETVNYLESFVNYEKVPAWPYKESLKLERIREFLGVIGEPQDALRCVHIAGTKGKGSTCAFIAYVLKEAGYKVGLYTSPHLSDFRERIRILSQYPPSAIQGPLEDFEGMISKRELTDLVQKLKPAIEKYNKESKYGPLSFFEVYTSLAFVYFKEEKVDLVVLETGLGGRLDATNAANSLVCGITPISYEHTQKLGNTLRQIASEKSGIIKAQSANRKAKNPVVISAPQEPEAIEVIRKRCRLVKSDLYEVGKDIIYRKIADNFEVKGVLKNYGNLKVKLIGRHQLVNAALAIGVIEALGAYDIKVGVDTIRKGLYNTAWPGRCEAVSINPSVVLDGAQNIASARVLKKAVKDNFKYKEIILVLGVSKDKDIEGICNELYELADRVILTRADNPRAAEPELLAENFKNKESYVTRGVKEAKEKSFQLAKKEDLILVCGSLFVVGEFRQLITKKENT